MKTGGNPFYKKIPETASGKIKRREAGNLLDF
jgi:acyl-coenzyme A synthetase/AMP-(fatty) acid ligase